MVQAIFLVSSVALVEQQARQVEEQTGLTVGGLILLTMCQVGSYCGADGVDDWDEEKWKAEISQHQVLVLVHQVFLDLMTHSFFRLSSAAVLVMDECHHAQVIKEPCSIRIIFKALVFIFFFLLLPLPSSLSFYCRAVRRARTIPTAR